MILFEVSHSNKARTETINDGKGSSLVRGVELGGFEPPTSSMPWKRATNCAIAPSGSSPISDADNSMESRAAGANLPRVRYLTSPRALLIHGVGVSTGGRSDATRSAAPDTEGSGRARALPRCQVPPHQHPPRLPPT